MRPIRIPTVYGWMVIAAAGLIVWAVWLVF